MAASSPNSSNSISSFVMNKSVSKNINALLEGVKWGSGGVGTGATIYYSFPASNDASLWSTDYTSETNSELNSGFRALSSFQQTQATLALQSWSNVANLDLQFISAESSSAVGDIRVAFTSGRDMDASTYAYAYLPNGVAYGGDVWINANQPVASGDNYNIGANGYQTLIHELGHALGLAHPFEGSVKLAANFEHLKYTVMSYSDAPKHQDTGASSFYPTTPMLYDIQAIQYLYGANMSYNASDNVYVFDENATYYQTIWDAGGSDTIQYNSNIGGTINLSAGNFSRMGQSVYLDKGTYTNETIAIAYNVTIENAVGGNGNDIITGNVANNQLDGGAGADQLIGAKGNDTYLVDIALSGNKIILQDKIVEAKNAGNDTLILRGNFDASHSITALKLLSNLENIDLSQTNAFNLNLTGDKSVNNLVGNAGNNVLDGGAGADNLTGGLGDDTYVLDQAGDIFTEALNEGTDTLVIKFANSGVYTLADHLENAVISGSKTFNILSANTLDNSLTGNGKANTIYGGFGNDTLNGGAGNDKLYGDEGNDVFTGGLGADAFVWSWDSSPNTGNPNIDVVTDFSLKQKDLLNFKDLLGGESKSEIDNLLNFIDISLNGNQTEFRISATGQFSDGLYDASKEDARIVLQNINLFGSSEEHDVLAMLVNKNFLIVD